MNNMNRLVNYAEGMDKAGACAAPRPLPYAGNLNEAASNVETVLHSLSDLRAAITKNGRDPQCSEAACVPDSLYDALNVVPAQINDLCTYCEKEISAIRELLRL